MNARDIAAQLAPRMCEAASITAGGAGDNTEVDGDFHDRQGFLSCLLIIAFEAVLGAAETLSIAANLQDANDDQGAGVADFGDALASAVVATGGAGGTTERGVATLKADLSAARQFVRAQFTPDLSAGAADTAIVVGVLVFGGADEIPTS